MTVGMNRWQTAAVAVGGVAATVGLYWDDAWHTDVGRDTFFAPPHLLLYAGVGLLLAVAALWAWHRYLQQGLAVLRDPAVTLPVFGAAVTLASAPVDEVWHQLFGRDAVVWSPPHMVAVAGMLAFAAGLLLAATRGRPAVRITAVIGGFLIAAAGTAVMEFEADVPQFPVVLYLPVLVATLTLAFALIRTVAPRGWTVTWAAAVYMGLRVAVVGYLLVLDHSLPTVMPTVAAAAAFDIALRRFGSRRAVATVTTIATVGSHVAAHAMQPAGLTFTAPEVLVGIAAGVPLAWTCLAVLGVGSTPRLAGRHRVAVPAAAALLGIVALAGPAAAHDPGQGQAVADVTLAADRDGGQITLHVQGRACQQWAPLRVVARRAGRVHEAPLSESGTCRFSATVDVDDPGRWFVYAEFTVAGAHTETWLPVEHEPATKQTVLYLASPDEGPHTGQVVAGVVLYGLVVGILAAVVVAYRRATRPRSPATASRGRRGVRAAEGEAVGAR